MNRNTIIFLVIGLIIILLGVSYYFFGSNLSNIGATISQKLNSKSIKLESNQFTIINNSKSVKVNINDEKKLEQIFRRYERLFATYKSLELTIEDTPQEINFGWGDGAAFGYTIEPSSDSILKISLRVNTKVIDLSQWHENDIEDETETTFINSLERSTINLDPQKKATYSGPEEDEKSTLIDEATVMALDELYTDNNNRLFKIKIL
jgi:hypothetical protein